MFLMNELIVWMGMIHSILYVHSCSRTCPIFWRRWFVFVKLKCNASGGNLDDERYMMFESLNRSRGETQYFEKVDGDFMFKYPVKWSKQPTKGFWSALICGSKIKCVFIGPTWAFISSEAFPFSEFYNAFTRNLRCLIKVLFLLIQDW